MDTSNKNDTENETLDNNLERFWQWRWSRIQAHLDAKEWSEAHALCANLINDASTPILLQVHCHTCMATFNIDPLVHAETAKTLLNKIEGHIPGDTTAWLKSILNKAVSNAIDKHIKEGVVRKDFSKDSRYSRPAGGHSKNKDDVEPDEAESSTASIGNETMADDLRQLKSTVLAAPIDVQDMTDTAVWNISLSYTVKPRSPASFVTIAEL